MAAREQSLVDQDEGPDALIEAAVDAEDAGDLERALLAWEALRRRHPDQARGFVSAGLALKQLDRLPEAVTLLALGVSRFPANEWLAKEHAWAVLELGNLTQAAAHWRYIRRLFPDNTDGYVGGGLTYRRAGLFAAAEVIYRAGLQRLPENSILYVDLAWCAEEQEDLPETIRRWDDVRVRFPDLLEGHFRSGLALLRTGRLEDADSALGEALARVPDDEEVLTEYARAAHYRQDWSTALRRWEAVLVRFPQAIPPRLFAAQALMELGRANEAVGVLGPALRMAPDDPEICILNGWLATRCRDFKKAEQIWADACQRFPDRVEGYRGQALALRDDNRLPEAEVLLARAVERFPDDPIVAMDFAEMPERRRNWAVAIDRWRAVIDRFPELAGGYIGLGNSLVGARNLAEAATVFAAGAERFPHDVELATEATRAATKSLDAPAARQLWSELQSRFPQSPTGYLGLGRSLRESGALTEAVTHLTEASQRFPHYLDLEVELAFALGARRDWPQALPLLDSLKRRFPGNYDVRSCINFVLGEAVADQNAHGEATFEIPATLLADADDAGAELAGDTAALLKRFESLGDTCEFGIVQRLYEVEQMSLLRWARTDPTNLIEALKNRLAGVGEPEFTVVEITNDEYTTADRRYTMHSHTFTPPAAEPLETFAPEQLRRMQWLRRKLLENLKVASKIFVYKYEEGISDADALGLHDALLDYSPRNRLLCVRLEEPGHPSGSLHAMRDGLCMGYLDKFSNIDISVSAWLTLCRSAWELRP